jgi:hypothetical protein
VAGGAPSSDLVAPLANMLTAAIEAGGLNGDERPADDYTATSGPARHRLCATVDAHASAERAVVAAHASRADRPGDQ